MEKCVLTGRLLNEDQTITTEFGPVASFLWGRDQIKYDEYDFALLPEKLIPYYRKVFGEEPRPDLLVK
jgi:hypothetical protein